MKRFRDRDGAEWDVVLGRESWGLLLALFVPRAPGPARQTPLAASGLDTGAQELDELDDDALQALLDRSDIKEEG
jgi:hypothetical protein